MKTFDVALGLLVILYVLDWQVWFKREDLDAVSCKCGDVAADEYDRLRVFADFLNNLPE